MQAIDSLRSVLSCSGARPRRCAKSSRTAARPSVMSRMARVRFTNGELPEAMDVVRTTIPFAAGQGTTARLISAGIRFLAEQPALAEELRSDRRGRC